MALWYLTLGAVTRQVHEWGLAVESIEYYSQAVDVLTLVEPVANLAAAELAAYGTAVELAVQTDPTDAGTLRRIFVGTLVEPAHEETGPSARRTWVAHGPWRFIERLMFEQTVAIVDPDGTPAPGQTEAYETLRWSHCFLGYRVVASTTPGTLPYTAERITSKVQIEEALDYVLAVAAEVGVAAPFQYDTSGLDSILVPVDERRDVFCHEVIRNQLRWTPGVTWFDYSTSPPTLHVSTYANCQPATLEVAGVDAVQLRELPELRRDAVALTYQIIGENGYGTVQDTWPLGASQRGFSVLRSTIDVQGGRQSRTYATVRTAALNTGNLTWLRGQFPELTDSPSGYVGAQSPKITNLSATLLGSVPSGYTRYVEAGDVPDWVGASQRVVLSWAVSYQVVVNENGTDVVIASIAEEIRSKEFTLTNVASGTYSQVTSEDSGDSLPPTGEGGLANQIYNWASRTPVDGRHIRRGAEPEFENYLGRRLNFAGGKTDWETLDAACQGVILRPRTGTTEIAFGWPVHLGVTDLIELFRVTRERRIFNNPGSNASGSLSPAADLNSTVSDRGAAGFRGSKLIVAPKYAAATTQTRVILDATTAVVPLEVNTGTGGVNGTPQQRAQFNFGDMPSTFDAKFRQMSVCIDGVEYTAWFFCTAPVAV